jgi:NSS family neurotransmitter:Na+ symporter
VVLGASVALVDVGIAIMSGMLIIPAMYVALANGVTIFNEAGQLIGGDQLIFTVIPALFDTMGSAGDYVAFVFFVLMTIAALTSSISMLEVPVAYTIESTKLERKGASWLIGVFVVCISLVLIFNFEALFGLVITVTTKYSQPLLGFMLCIFTGWVWKRDSILQEIKQGADDVESSVFWKIWPVYVRFVCPLIILAMAYHTVFVA